MASNRHLGRIIALQTLYEQDFRRASEDTSFDLEAVLGRNIARYEATVDDTAFIERLVRGVSSHEAELDATLGPIAPEWPIEQIARMDRVVLRIGLYELEYEKDVPPKVVINEAVELAKAFGSENSSKFVNGVLGTVLRQRDGESANAPAASEAQNEAAPEKGPAAKTANETDVALGDATSESTPSAASPDSADSGAAESASTPAKTSAKKAGKTKLSGDAAAKEG